MSDKLHHSQTDEKTQWMGLIVDETWVMKTLVNWKTGQKKFSKVQQRQKESTREGSRGLRHRVKKCNILLMRVSKGGERQSEEELIFKEIAVDSFLELMKYSKPKTQISQRTQNVINEKLRSRLMVNPQRTRGKQNLQSEKKTNSNEWQLVGCLLNDTNNHFQCNVVHNKLKNISSKIKFYTFKYAFQEQR